MPKRLPVRKPPQTEKKTEGSKWLPAVEMGQRGGEKGGPARARKLSANQRHSIAVNAAITRWREQRRKHTG